MDIGFILAYIVIPMIVGYGIMSGKRSKNHLRIGSMLCFKSFFYLYCAAANIVHYLNNTWAIRYVAGLAIALSIMEFWNGMVDCLFEFQQEYKNE